MATFRFTKASIEALPRPTKGWRFHYDTEVAGLSVAIGPEPTERTRGNRTFYLYRRILGRPEKIKLGAYPDLTIERARAAATRHNAEIADGKNPAEIARALRAEITLQQLFERYLAEHAQPRGKKTIDGMKDNFTRYLGDIGTPVKKARGRLRSKPQGSVEWQDRRLSQIGEQDVRKLHAALGAGCGPYVANRVIQLLRAIFNFGMRAGELPSRANPAAGIELFPEEERERFLLPDEARRFFESLANEPNESIRTFFLASILTGARRANVLAMQWTHLNLETGEWRIPGGEMKNGKPQTVVLVPELVAALGEQRKRTEASATAAGAQAPAFLFPGIGESGHLASPKKAWARLLKRAGIVGLRIHDLRRSLGSWQAREGASLSIIGKSLNHRSVQTTAIYARLDMDPVRQSVEKATSALLIAGGVKQAATVEAIEPRTRRPTTRR